MNSKVHLWFSEMSQYYVPNKIHGQRTIVVVGGGGEPVAVAGGICVDFNTNRIG